MSTLIIKAIAAARKHNAPMYLYCTSVRWIIAISAPDFNPQYIKVTPDGAVNMHEYDHEVCMWTISPVAAA